MAVRVVTDPRPPSLPYDLLGMPEGVKEERQVSRAMGERWKGLEIVPRSGLQTSGETGVHIDQVIPEVSM